VKSACPLFTTNSPDLPEEPNNEISIPLVQMNALIGLLSDVLADALIESSLAPEAKLKTIRAFNKLMWIQNDFISRHYVI
jgi:hypothetical protein